MARSSGALALTHSCLAPRRPERRPRACSPSGGAATMSSAGCAPGDGAAPDGRGEAAQQHLHEHAVLPEGDAAPRRRRPRCQNTFAVPGTAQMNPLHRPPEPRRCRRCAERADATAAPARRAIGAPDLELSGATHRARRGRRWRRTSPPASTYPTSTCRWPEAGVRRPCRTRTQHSNAGRAQRPPAEALAVWARWPAAISRP